MTNMRPDIQALRGIAVLAVLAYHAKVPFFKGGYLGVDIFFVVSGYLITGLIARSMSEGNFSFSQFYWRRAWRLLPAAYVVFLVCAVAAPWLLTAGEQRDFIKQLIGAVTFTGNIALWLQTGYFEQAAELKPLLHVWSLAIEEQYYLLLPVAMLWISPRRWRLAAILATLASAVACFVQMPTMPGAVFYLLPTRAWELGVGSIVALMAPSFEKVILAFPRRRLLSVAALAGLSALIFVPGQTFHPGWTTALACILTAVTVANGVSWPGLRFGTSLLAWFGDRSYSLYLVHWPLFAFLNSANISGGGAPWHFRLSAMVVSVIAAVLLFRYVEKPLRLVGHDRVAPKRTVALAFAGLPLFVLAGSLWFQQSNNSDYAVRLRSNPGIGPVCDQHDQFEHRAECTAGTSSPRVLVWGDSFAMHWVSGLVAGGLTVVQATKSTCAPLPQIALYAPPKQPTEWAKACLAFNADVGRMVNTTSDSFDIVIMASPWGYLFNANTLNSSGQSAILTIEQAVDLLVAHVRDIRSRGGRVILMAPLPSAGFDVGRCIERKESRLLKYGGTSDCSFSLESSRRLGETVRSFLQIVSQRADVSVIDPEFVLCSSETGSCTGQFGGTVVYRDAGHLSYEGSVELARRMKLAEEVLRAAR